MQHTPGLAGGAEALAVQRSTVNMLVAATGSNTWHVSTQDGAWGFAHDQGASVTITTFAQQGER